MPKARWALRSILWYVRRAYICLFEFYLILLLYKKLQKNIRQFFVSFLRLAKSTNIGLGQSKLPKSFSTLKRKLPRTNQIVKTPRLYGLMAWHRLPLLWLTVPSVYIALRRHCSSFKFCLTMNRQIAKIVMLEIWKHSYAEIYETNHV